MFNNSKYTSWYYQIIDSAKNSIPVVFENHHIIPRSLGGTNSKENLVHLTPRQHFICHLLLIRMTEGLHKRSMVFASQMMCMKSVKHERTYKISSRTYQYLRTLRKQFPSPLLGTKLADETKAKISKSLTGKTHSEESKAKISANHYKFASEETKLKISQSKSGIATRGTGWQTPEETKLKQSLSQKGRPLSEEHKAKLRKPKKQKLVIDPSSI